MDERKVPDRIGIEERPALVDKKERIGDFEMDTIVGKDQKSRLPVAVERKTNRRHPQDRQLQSTRCCPGSDPDAEAVQKHGSHHHIG